MKQLLTFSTHAEIERASASLLKMEADSKQYHICFFPLDSVLIVK